MSSAGKWVLGLLLLVVGAVFVARTVSSDPGSQAEVKNLPAASPVASAKDGAKKAVPTVAADVVCKKACIEVNEVANDSVTTAKLAPGSVTLSKLAFEVPNLNELENEINARKAAEASVKAAQAEAAAAGAKNDAAITAAAANGLTIEAAARTAADEELATKFAAGDADLLSKLNKEINDRATGDDALQLKLNNEIADRASAMSSLRGELLDPNEVAAPIIKINNNEIVASAVRGGAAGVIQDESITTADLGVGSVGTSELIDDSIQAIDLANDSVIGRAAGETLTNVKANSLRGQRTNNLSIGAILNGDFAIGTITGEGGAGPGLATGNLALGTVTGEGTNTTNADPVGNLGLQTVGRNNLVNDAINGTKIEDGTVGADDLGTSSVVGGAAGDVLDGSISADDLGTSSVVGGAGGDVLDGSITADDLGTSSVVGGAAGDILDGSITSDDLGTDSVTVAKLASDVDLILSTLDTRLNNLALSPSGVTDTDRVSTHRLVGISTRTASLDPSNIAAATRSAEVITVATGGDVSVGDLVTVSPPAALDAGLLLVGSEVTGTNQVTVYLYNSTAAPINDGSRTWTIQVVDLTP